MLLGPDKKLALTRCVSKADLQIARDRVAAGKFHVDFVVRVCGDFTVRSDTFRRSTSHIPLTVALAIALKKSGIQRENIKRALMDLVIEAITRSEDEEWMKANMTEFESSLEEVESMLTMLPPVPLKGAVVGSPTVDLLIDNTVHSGS